MKNVAFWAATAAIMMTAPAFAGADKTKQAAGTTAPVPASVRISEVTFDLDAQGGVTGQIAPQDSAGVFASQNEVKLENFSFDLK